MVVGGKSVRLCRLFVVIGATLAATLLIVCKIGWGVPAPSLEYPIRDDQRPVLLTAFSAGHFDEAQGLARSIHEHLPQYRFIVYDMGLGEAQRRRLVKYCRCEVRTLNFALYPPHVRNLTTYAFKPLLVAQLMKESGFVFWLDASIRIVSSNVTALWQLVRSTGFAASGGVFSVTCLTHPSMFAYFNVNDSSAFRRIAELQATFLLFYALPETVKLVVEPWRRCSLDPTCIAPDGPRRETCTFSLNPSYCGCHRFDQSALNVIIHATCGPHCRGVGTPFSGYLGPVWQLSKQYDVVRVRRDETAKYFPEE